MDSLLQRPGEATIQDLLAGSKDGWRTNADGRRVRTALDPVLLVQHFRRIGAQWNRLRNGLSVHQEMLLTVLWLALREKGWLISRQAAQDAWYLASVTPTPTGGGASCDPF